MDSALAVMVKERAGRPWCLFLDRDGVINTRIMDGYVRSWDEFHFEPGALEALKVLAQWAPLIVVVTNQQGVGKGVMGEDALDEIHARMTRDVARAGGRIDAVVACTHLAADDCPCRKPQPGLALDYLRARTDLDGSLSVMVGDTPSDIEMGRRLGAVTGGSAVLRIAPDVDPIADATFASLAAFAAAIGAAGGVSAQTAE